MTNAGPQVPDIPAPPPPPQLHNNPKKPTHQAQQGQQIVHLNWSYFKPEFSGKPEEDAEAHLLWTSNWMNTHQFLEGIKVNRFCLTLTGETRLWYESLQPINIDW